ncbi:uncharacterized protein N7443_006529 [Penicillium atrosanguineum]|uniref:uncharacterized protein n=1 Tax=Penicillium atrosanguineum TaxID=1132637 RepID=UPI0023A1FF68|nr:uncharacterized protein N7443_006529 [Penicillium atrosanguineum]KAJ5298409.1 hypothetical protein N7443_006529 [Penicillium atrosanguineum]
MLNHEIISISEPAERTCNTPTHTTVFDDPVESKISNPIDDGDAVGPPYEGGTYIIRNTQTKLAITLRDSLLCLVPQDTENDRASHWHCEAGTLNWLGFCNAVSGTYIGYNIHGNIIAEARHHLWWEYCSIRPHPGGGYQLLVLHWFENKPIRIGDEGTQLVLGTREERETGTDTHIEQASTAWAEGTWWLCTSQDTAVAYNANTSGHFEDACSDVSGKMYKCVSKSLDFFSYGVQDQLCKVPGGKDCVFEQSCKQRVYKASALEYDINNCANAATIGQAS